MPQQDMMLKQMDLKIQNMQMKDEQVEQAGIQVVAQQLEFEKAQDWRKGFLAGNGLSADFVERTARVRGAEPVIKESDDKDQQKMYNKVTSKYEKARKRVDKNTRTIQKQKAKETGMTALRSKNMGLGGEYETLLKGRNMLLRRQREMGASDPMKSVLEKMYSDLYAACEVKASYTNQIFAYRSILRDEDVAGNEEMKEEVMRRLSVLEERQRLANDRSGDLLDGMNLLSMNEEERALLLEHASERAKDMVLTYTNMFSIEGWQTSRAAVARQEVTRTQDLKESRRAKMHALVKEALSEMTEDVTDEAVDELMEEKQRYMLASDTDEELNRSLAKMIAHGDEQVEDKEDVEAYKNAAAAHLIKIEEFPVESFAAMGDAELMRHTDELAELQVVSDALMQNRKVLLPAEGEWDKRGRFYGQYRELEVDYMMKRDEINPRLLDIKLRFIDAVAKKARMLWYVEAYKLGQLNAGMIAPEDKAEVTAKGVSRHDLMEAASETYVKCCQKQDRALVKHRNASKLNIFK